MVFRLAPRWKTVGRPVRDLFAPRVLRVASPRAARDGRMYARRRPVDRKRFLALMNTDYRLRLVVTKLATPSLLSSVSTGRHRVTHASHHTKTKTRNKIIIAMV